MKNRENLKKPKSAVCFDAPSWYELVVEGKKVAGSAQTRQKGVILQHGAILLDLDEEKLISLLNLLRKTRERMRNRHYVEKAVAINQIIKTESFIRRSANAFKKGFEEALNIELVAI